MVLRDLYLYQFRNYQQEYFSFHPRRNILLGPNGAGKTSVLEAIHVLSLVRSFQKIRDRNLCCSGSTSPAYSVIGNCEYSQDAEEKKLSVQYENQKKSYVVDDQKTLAAGDFIDFASPLYSISRMRSWYWVARKADGAS